MSNLIHEWPYQFSHLTFNLNWQNMLGLKSDIPLTDDYVNDTLEFATIQISNTHTDPISIKITKGLTKGALDYLSREIENITPPTNTDIFLDPRHWWFTVKIKKDMSTRGFYGQTSLTEIILKREFMGIIGKTETGGDISFKCNLDDVTATSPDMGAKNIKLTTHPTEIKEYVRRYANRAWVYYLDLPMTGTNFFDFANRNIHKFVVKSPVKLNPQEVGICQALILMIKVNVEISLTQKMHIWTMTLMC